MCFARLRVRVSFVFITSGTDPFELCTSDTASTGKTCSLSRSHDTVVVCALSGPVVPATGRPSSAPHLPRHFSGLCDFRSAHHGVSRLHWRPAGETAEEERSRRGRVLIMALGRSTRRHGPRITDHGRQTVKTGRLCPCSVVLLQRRRELDRHRRGGGASIHPYSGQRYEGTKHTESVKGELQFMNARTGRRTRRQQGPRKRRDRGAWTTRRNPLLLFRFCQGFRVCVFEGEVHLVAT